MKNVILFAILLYPAAFFSQELSRGQLDSLFYLYNDLKNPVAADGKASLDTSSIKCGFSLVNSVRINFEKFTPEQQNKLAEAFQRPTLQQSIISPKGYFRIHYDTAGTNSVKYNLQELLLAADSSYDFEVNSLGYNSPADNNSGGDDRYDIYIMNIGLYGYTELEERISGRMYNSFMVIDNDYTHTGTRGIDGARVTIAHELHHAIQLGGYGYSEQDIFFHELSSTAMEEFVFDSINDYYFYLSDYFELPDLSFPNHNGYDLAIWNIFLQKEFGFDILKDQWDILREGSRAMDAMALSIGRKSSNFQDVFNKFGIWVYFTGYRAQQGKYFEEAAEYPVIRSMHQLEFSPPSDSFSVSVQPVTQNFITVTNSPDTLDVLITNSDYKNAIINPDARFSALYELSSDSADGLNKLTDGYYQRFVPSGMNAFWTTSEFLNNQLIREGFVRIETSLAFPSPFRYGAHSFIYFPVKDNFEHEAELYVYSASMDLVYSSRLDIKTMFGKNIISWNGRTFRSQMLGSGIYLYIIKSDEDISKGKIVIFND